MKSLVNIGVIFFLLGITLYSSSIITLTDGTKITTTSEIADDGENITFQTPVLGEITLSKESVLSIRDSEKEEVRDSSIGEPIKHEDAIINNMLRFLPRSLKNTKTEDVKNVAIKRIKVNGGYALNDKVLETKIINSIVKNGYFNVIERQSLSLLLEEQELSISGLTEDEESKVGKLIGVDAFLDIEVSPDARSIDSTMKLNSVEKNIRLWEDSFHGEVSGDLTIAAGINIRAPFSYYFYIDREVERVTEDLRFEGQTAPIFGPTIKLGQRLPFFKMLEVGLSLGWDTDFLAQANETESTYAFTSSDEFLDNSMLSATNIHTIANGGYIPANYIIPNTIVVNIKWHLMDLFSVPYDIVNLYGGIGISMGRINYYGGQSKVKVLDDGGVYTEEYDAEEEEGAFVDTMLNTAVVGMELKWKRVAIFGEYTFFLSKSGVAGGTYNYGTDDIGFFRLGVIYYILN